VPQWTLPSTKTSNKETMISCSRNVDGN
jgi:hypothetical protein